MHVLLRLWNRAFSYSSSLLVAFLIVWNVWNVWIVWGVEVLVLVLMMMLLLWRTKAVAQEEEDDDGIFEIELRVLE